MRRFRVDNNKCIMTSWYMYYCFISKFSSFAMYSKAFRFIITVVRKQSSMKKPLFKFMFNLNFRRQLAVP